MTETALFLSPHLDDAVLSSPGRILAEVARGRRAIVATLFTEADESPDQRGLYRRRREEDLCAVETLGAEARWLGLPDAPFRHAFYSSFRTIVLEMHPEDESYVEQVAATTRVLLDQVGPRSLHVPLGVGTHIDHRLTYAAIERLIEDGILKEVPILYYEDRPYSFIRHQVRMRLAELEIRVADPSPANLGPLPPEDVCEEFLRSFGEAPYVKTHLPPGPEHELCRRRLAEKLTRPSPPSRVRAPEILTLESPEFERCVEAVAAYRSQIEEFFGSLEAFIEAARRYTRWLGIDALYAERAWR